MPQANITYDAPYNRKLVSILDEMDEKHWQKAYPAYHPNPLGYRLGAFHGEMVGGGSSPLKYNPSGNSPAYPPHNLAAGLAVHSGGSHYSGIDGAVGGFRHPAEKMHGGDFGQDFLNGFTSTLKAAAPFAPLLLGLGEKKKRASRKKGGDWKDDLGSIGRTLASAAAPVAQAYARKRLGLGRKKKEMEGGLSWGDIGNALSGVAKEAAPILAPLAADYAKKRLGLGRKKKGGKEVPLSDMLEMSVPVGKGSTGGKRTNKRAEIVKKVMREKGLKLIEASKYVKANNLY